MKLVIRHSQIIKKIKHQSIDGLFIVGAEAAGFVAEKLRSNKSVESSNLVNSITWTTSKKQASVNKATDGRKLKKPSQNSLSVKVGTTVVYSARVEFGFIGKDSLGRTYHQPPKSYLIAGIKAHRKKLQRTFATYLKLRNQIGGSNA